MGWNPLKMPPFAPPPSPAQAQVKKSRPKPRPVKSVEFVPDSDGEEEMTLEETEFGGIAGKLKWSRSLMELTKY